MTAAFIQQRRPEFYFASDKGGGKLWIHCGGKVPLATHGHRIWIAVMEDVLSARSDEAASWSWDDHSEHQRYVRPPSRNGYYASSRDPAGAEWQTIIAPAFFAYLDELCTRGPRPDPRTSSAPGLCEEIASWGGQRSRRQASSRPCGSRAARPRKTAALASKEHLRVPRPPQRS